MKNLQRVNTILLALILIALVGLIVGGITLVGSVREMTRPLEAAGQAIEERLREVVNPTPTIVPDPVTIIHKLRALSRLETVAYTVEKVITAESGQGPLAFLFGDRLILVAHGQVIAGVDLAKITEEDIVASDDGTVTISLPPAEVFVATLDNQKSYVFDRDTGVVGLQPALETDARKAAEEEILSAALEDGILDMAQRNAETYLRQLVLSLDFREVVLLSPTPTPSPTSS
jgi:hypothetical protein